MILAGDIGGTKSNLALFAADGHSLRVVFQRRLATRDYPDFDHLIGHFLKQSASVDSKAIPLQLEAAAFGVAGVVAGGKHYSENLPWVVDGSAIAQRLGLKKVRLINDLAATALSLERLAPSDFVVLNRGEVADGATKGVIAAGTGLGEALLFWDGQKYRVGGAEGGQAGFAPQTEREIQLLVHFRGQLPYVSIEEIVSGRGFRRIHYFLDPSIRHESFDGPSGSSAAEITQRALADSCPVCTETVDFWVEIFGGVTGNFALQTMALGGIYIAGGIAVRVLQKLQDRAFFKAFCGLSLLAPVLAKIPISVVINEDAPMWGAAYTAMIVD